MLQAIEFVCLPQARDLDENEISARVAAEFPSVAIRFRTEPAPEVHLRASQWDRPDFDNWRFDAQVDDLAVAPFTLRVADDRGDRAALPLEVLNRCQRATGRRNQYSTGAAFDQVLQRHRELYDLSKPLVRADYRHALDTWQWLLRLQPEASLSLQFAALFHDIERTVSEGEKGLDQLAADDQQFKDGHARGGASIARRALEESGVPDSVAGRAALLVALHERASADDADVVALNDADALSFLSLNSGGYADYFGPDQTRRKIRYTWNRMSAAARAKLGDVHLRPDVARLLDEVRGMA